MARAVAAACWLYASAAVATWAVARWAPAGFWPVHLLLYGPRWALILPLLPLIPMAASWRSRWSPPALWVASAAFWGVWGFVVPVPGRSGGGDGRARPSLRVLTCNVQGRDLRVDALGSLIREARPDLVLLQECRPADAAAALVGEPWRVRSEGEFTVASRLPIAGFSALRAPGTGSRVIAVRAELSRSGRTIPVVSAHLMSPRRGLEAVIRSPLGGLGSFRESAAVLEAESGLLRRLVGDDGGAALVAGDFNLTSEHPLYRRDWSTYRDAFSASGAGLGETMFTRRIGLRIDHILCGPGWRPDRCWVGPDVGSDHRPVLADLSWVGRSGGPAGP